MSNGRSFSIGSPLKRIVPVVAGDVVEVIVGHIGPGLEKHDSRQRQDEQRRIEGPDGRVTKARANQNRSGSGNEVIRARGQKERNPL